MTTILLYYYFTVFTEFIHYQASKVQNNNRTCNQYIAKSKEPLLTSMYFSKLTAINSEAFAVKAKDADGDTILYILDLMSVGDDYLNLTRIMQ